MNYSFRGWVLYNEQWLQSSARFILAFDENLSYVRLQFVKWVYRELRSVAFTGSNQWRQVLLVVLSWYWQHQTLFWLFYGHGCPDAWLGVHLDASVIINRSLQARSANKSCKTYLKVLHLLLRIVVIVWYFNYSKTAWSDALHTWRTRSFRGLREVICLRSGWCRRGDTMSTKHLYNESGQ